MKKIILAAAMAAFVLASCGVDYDKTASGLVYKIYPGKGGDSLKAGEYVKYTVAFILADRAGKKDSLLNQIVAMPNYVQVDTSQRATYSFMEIMPKLQSGDSALVILSVDSLKKRNAINPADSIIFVNGSTIQCRFKILKVFKEEKDVMADYQTETEADNKRQVKSVEDFMATRGLKGGIKTKSGAYVIIDNPGDTTMKADSGMIAFVKYKGYLMADSSKVFDTNFDTSKAPYEVPVGTQSVIAGWDETLPYFGKGGSGKIYIPSFMGYGPQPSRDIPAFSNLIFEIRVVDVKVAPPPTAPKQMPGGNPMGH